MNATATPAAWTVAADVNVALGIADTLWSALVAMNAQDGTRLPISGPGSAWTATEDAIVATLAAAWPADAARAIFTAAIEAYQAPSTVAMDALDAWLVEYAEKQAESVRLWADAEDVDPSDDVAGACTPDDDAACACVMLCDPAAACSLAREWHVHPGAGTCPVHPDAPRA